jgi:hypothetical protein
LFLPESATADYEFHRISEQHIYTKRHSELVATKPQTENRAKSLQEGMQKNNHQNQTNYLKITN